MHVTVSCLGPGLGLGVLRVRDGLLPKRGADADLLTTHHSPGDTHYYLLVVVVDCLPERGGDVDLLLARLHARRYVPRRVGFFLAAAAPPQREQPADEVAQRGPGVAAPRRGEGGGEAVGQRRSVGIEACRA